MQLLVEFPKMMQKVLLEKDDDEKYLIFHGTDELDQKRTQFEFVELVESRLIVKRKKPDLHGKPRTTKLLGDLEAEREVRIIP